MKYVYNEFGQLITEYQQDTDGDGTWDLIQSRTSNKVNEIADITETTGTSWTTPGYNKSGNMTTIPIPTDPTTSYTATYDGWNRLVKLEDDANTITKYQYDGLRRRIIHKAYNTGVLNHTKHLYYNNNWQLLEERRDSNTSPTKQYIWGTRYIDDLVIRDHDTDDNGTLNERLYALQDTNWNVTSYVNESGIIQERYIYNAYGTVTFLDANFGVISSSVVEPDHLYAGYNFDADVEMYHVRNRVYHPTIGTWLQRDPIGYDAGDVSLLRYVGSVSISYLDPLGLKFEYNFNSFRLGFAVWEVPGSKKTKIRRFRKAGKDYCECVLVQKCALHAGIQLIYDKFLVNDNYLRLEGQIRGLSELIRKERTLQKHDEYQSAQWERGAKAANGVAGVSTVVGVIPGPLMIVGQVFAASFGILALGISGLNPYEDDILKHRDNVENARDKITDIEKQLRRMEYRYKDGILEGSWHVSGPILIQKRSKRVPYTACLLFGLTTYQETMKLNLCQQ